MNTRSEAAIPYAADPQHTLEDVLAAEIRVPMAALRAALEGLAKDDRHDDATMHVLEAAAEEVGRLSLKFRTLIDAALAATPARRRCSMMELSGRVRRSIDPRVAARVSIACDDPHAAFELDASRLGVALAGLAESLAAGGAEVMLRFDARDGFEARAIASAAEHNGAYDARRPSFVEHELEALGMQADWRTTDGGGVRVALRASSVRAMGGAA